MSLGVVKNRDAYLQRKYLKWRKRITIFLRTYAMDEKLTVGFFKDTSLAL